MRHRLGRDDIHIASAGLQAMVGDPIDPTAQEVLFEHGMDGAAHRARQASRSVLAAADLILVMEKKHLNAIAREAPQASGKAFLLGKWRGDREVPDPYRQSKPAFDHVYALIEDGVTGWLPYIK